MMRGRHDVHQSATAMLDDYIRAHLSGNTLTLVAPPSTHLIAGPDPVPVLRLPASGPYLPAAAFPTTRGQRGGRRSPAPPPKPRTNFSLALRELYEEYTRSLSPLGLGSSMEKNGHREASPPSLPPARGGGERGHQLASGAAHTPPRGAMPRFPRLLDDAYYDEFDDDDYDGRSASSLSSFEGEASLRLTGGEMDDIGHREREALPDAESHTSESEGGEADAKGAQTQMWSSLLSPTPPLRKQERSSIKKSLTAATVRSLYPSLFGVR